MKPTQPCALPGSNLLYTDITMKTKPLRPLLIISLLLLFSACDVIENYLDLGINDDYEEPAPTTPPETNMHPRPFPDFSLPLFSPDSIWNTPIEADAPIDPESDAMIERLIMEHEQGANVDLSVDEWSVTVFFADEDTPRMDVELHPVLVVLLPRHQGRPHPAGGNARPSRRRPSGHH